MSDTEKTAAAIGQEAGSVKAPELTLDPEERKIDLSFMEPTLEKDQRPED